MGLYGEHVLPRLVDLTCGGERMERWRRRAIDGLRGTVVEIGFGSGPNLPLLPADVDAVYAVEPSEVARRRSTRRPRRPGLVVEHVGLDGESIPLPDASCDAALTTFTLCTVPHVDRALAELRRVVRPGGRIHFLEHGRSPDDHVHRRQQRLEPVQRRLAGGCHLTRDTPELLSAAGFELERVDARYASGPKPWTWFTVGTAVNPEWSG